MAPPTELFEKPLTIEEVREAPPPDPTISGTPPVASGLSQPSTPVGESDEEFGSRVKNFGKPPGHIELIPGLIEAPNT